MNREAVGHELLDAALKRGNLLGATDTLPDRIAIIATGAGLHRRNQQALRRQGHLLVALDLDRMRFDGLLHHPQMLWRKGGQLFQEKHTVMGQCNFARNLTRSLKRGQGDANIWSTKGIEHWPTRQQTCERLCQCAFPGPWRANQPDGMRPAAATSIARLTCSCPRIVCRSLPDQRDGVV